MRKHFTTTRLPRERVWACGGSRTCTHKSITRLSERPFFRNLLGAAFREILGNFLHFVCLHVFVFCLTDLLSSPLPSSIPFLVSWRVGLQDHDTILFVSDKGVAYGIRAFQVPVGSRTAKGVPVPQASTNNHEECSGNFYYLWQSCPCSTTEGVLPLPRDLSSVIRFSIMRSRCSAPTIVLRGCCFVRLRFHSAERQREQRRLRNVFNAECLRINQRTMHPERKNLGKHCSSSMLDFFLERSRETVLPLDSVRM